MLPQGRVARKVSKHADLGLSSAFLRNHKLSDDVRSFSPKICNLCNFHTETVSYVLNQCSKMKNNYQKRHNRVIDLISQKINILKPQMFESEQEIFVNPHTRPDIVIINRNEKEVATIEISTPFDFILR